MSEFIKKAIHPIVNKDKNDKVQDRFVFNGTVLEVGGNIAVESIEQIGYIGDSEYPISGHLDYASQYPPIADGVTVATDVKSVVVTVGTAYGCPTDLPFLVKNGVVTSSDSIFWWIDGEDEAHYIDSTQGGELDIVGKCIVNASTEDNWSNLQYGEEFKPFFTEEQYQEILNLIA